MFSEIFATVLGLIIGWFFAGHQFRFSENSNLIDDHIADIERFANAALEHWTTSYSSDTEQLQRRDIARIRALHVPLPIFYSEAEFRLGKSQFREYQVLQLRLFKCALGGDFETIGRSSDGNVALDAQTIAWELIHNLRVARREQYGFWAVVASFIQRLNGKTTQYRDR